MYIEEMSCEITVRSLKARKRGLIRNQPYQHPDLGLPASRTMRKQICFCFVYLFIFGCVGSSLLHAVFLQLRQAGATLHCSARASHCGGFSCGTQALGVQASVVVAHGFSSCGSWALEGRLSSCGTQVQLLRGMWDLPRPGLKSVSPALAGRFLITAPPGKTQICCLNHSVCGILLWYPKQINIHEKGKNLIFRLAT